MTGTTAWDCGGLHFSVSFRAPAGATLRVYGDVDGSRTELLRFDDFVESPHYHAPASADAVLFDREALGEPLEWIVGQLRDHFTELMCTAGLAGVLDQVDVAEVADGAGRVRDAMVACVPDGYVRVPGVGLQLAGA
jgi:hypothetical protein